MMYNGMHRKLKETTGGGGVVIKTNIPVTRTEWGYGPGCSVWIWALERGTLEMLPWPKRNTTQDTKGWTLRFLFFCHIPISFIGESVLNPRAGIPVSQDKEQSRRERDNSENKQRNFVVMGATGVMQESESPGGWGLCGRSLCRAWYGFGQISRSFCHPWCSEDPVGRQNW